MIVYDFICNSVVHTFRWYVRNYVRMVCSVRALEERNAYGIYLRHSIFQVTSRNHPEKLLASLAGWITLVDCSNNIRYAVKSRHTVPVPNSIQQLEMGKGLECIRQQMQSYAAHDSMFQHVSTSKLICPTRPTVQLLTFCALTA